MQILSKTSDIVGKIEASNKLEPIKFEEKYRSLSGVFACFQKGPSVFNFFSKSFLLAFSMAFFSSSNQYVDSICSATACKPMVSIRASIFDTNQTEN